MRSRVLFASILSLTVVSCTGNSSRTSGNPLFEGWYADPEGIVFDHTCWIYPTWSQPYEEQLFMDAFSSRDLVHWTRHERVISQENISWLQQALWAPSVVEKEGTYYLRGRQSCRAFQGRPGASAHQ